MPENQAEGFTIIHKKQDILENTIGRLGAIPSYLLLGTPDALFEDIPASRVQELHDRYKDVKWNGNVEVYLGHSPLFRQMKRLFQSGRRTNVFLRTTYGSLYTLSAWLAGKLSRADAYNPWAETVQTYHPNIAVGLHEIGHAQDFEQSAHPTARALLYSLPIIRSKLEWNASRNAMQHLSSTERQEARKILEPALGTYIGRDALILTSLLYPPASLIRPLAVAISGAIAGHIHSRLPGTKNFFFNDQPVTPAEISAPPAAPAPALAASPAT